MPSAHASHPLLLEYVPELQAVHALAWSSAKSPAPQLEQLVVFVWEAKVPARQARHAPDAWLAVYVPGKQGLHLSAVVSEKVPGGQARQVCMDSSE